jgi:hypothetical protein
MKGIGLAAVVTGLLLTGHCIAQEQPIYQPSKDDPWIVAALDAQIRLGEVMAKRDIGGIEALMSPDLVVNAPINRVTDRTNVLARLRAGEISYEKSERKIEFAGVRGDSVVIMGEEIVQPNANAPHAGKTAHRRFTDVWKRIDGSWRLAIRQATYTQFE